MTPIPPKLRRKIEVDPFYKQCSLKEHHECGGRITLEHAIIFANRQVQELWAIIPLCAKGHAVDEYQDAGTLDKSRNIWVALNRATDEELQAVSKAIPWIRERDRLNTIYGVWSPPYIPQNL